MIARPLYIQRSAKAKPQDVTGPVATSSKSWSTARTVGSARAIATVMIRFRLRGEFMNVQAAVVREQAIVFAVVVVKPQRSRRMLKLQRVRAACIRCFFPGMPIVLMAQDASGRPTLLGTSRHLVVIRFLANVYMEALPWKDFTFARGMSWRKYEPGDPESEFLKHQSRVSEGKTGTVHDRARTVPPS